MPPMLGIKKIEGPRITEQQVIMRDLIGTAQNELGKTVSKSVTAAQCVFDDKTTFEFSISLQNSLAIHMAMGIATTMHVASGENLQKCIDEVSRIFVETFAATTKEKFAKELREEKPSGTFKH
ncbi:MAG: hypothetical protein COA69_13585 [Robiginitomaculum sp.]|nr:MAG: hypothetical protein COA69_13585 [Robiginitomaculum sp.]